MKVLRHTIYANGHVEYEALESGEVLANGVSHIMSLFVTSDTTEVTITKANGTVSTYTKVQDLVHGHYRLSENACGHEWEDGWGSGHRCSKVNGHPTNFHRCPCDANTRKSP